jgi:class 3 adenylate cyclase/tetratricopeptide (TPR) repeat protein
MRCITCSHENSETAKFCEECGANLDRTCIACGSPHSAAAKFCAECGKPIQQENSASDSTRHRYRSPETYTPKFLAEQILTSKAAMEGERKLVTVLVADLKGSMQLFEDRDPEEARRILDPVIDTMMDAVHHYEGTVNHVLGDGIVAIFGAPVAHEDHAIRACYAALRMQEKVRLYSESTRLREGIPVQIRVGLNSGVVVVRSIGNDLRMDYTVVGQTTNIAARMEQMAAPGTILISADTMAIVEGFVESKSLGTLNVKGLSHPIEVFEVCRATSVRSRIYVAAARGLSSFVGRNEEFGQLQEALKQVIAGDGQVTAVVGDPGLGKSRLLWEFVHSEAVSGWLVLDCASVSYGTVTPFLPVIDLLRNYLNVESDDDTLVISEKLRRRVFALDPTLGRYMPAFSWILDVPIDDEDWLDLEPSKKRQRAIEGIISLLLRESRKQPLLLLIEDLHWIDSQTQALVDGLVEYLQHERIFLLVNYRPEYQHSWINRPFYRQLNLKPLAAAPSEQLLDVMLGSRRDLEVVKRLLLNQAEGNPFFLEESVHALAEAGIVVGGKGAFELAVKPNELQIQIPATAQTVLAARIDRLPTHDKRLLQAASAIGKNFSYGLLYAIAGLSDDELRSGLGRLQASDFVYQVRLFPELEYTFKHALTHEVAYAAMLGNRRSALHKCILKELERNNGERTEKIEQLAYHAFRAEIWDRATNYMRSAGIKAAARSALREAANYLESALDALSHLSESKDSIETAIDIRLDLQGVLYPVAGIDQTLEHLRHAEVAAEALGDQLRLGRVSGHLAYCFYWKGALEEAVSAGERARSIAVELNDFSLQVSTNVRLGQTYFALGDFARAAELLEQNVEFLEGNPQQGVFGMPLMPLAFSQDRLAWCLAVMGHFDKARATLDRGVLLAESINHTYTLGNLYCSIGFVCTLRGEFTDGVQWTRRGFELSQSENIPLLAALSAWRLGEALVSEGQMEDGLKVLEQGCERLSELGHMGYYPRAVTALSSAYLANGMLDKADQNLSHAFQLCRISGQQAVEAEANLVLAGIESHRSGVDLTQALQACDQALQMSVKRGMRPLSAHCHLKISQLQASLGNTKEAAAEEEAAIHLFRDLGMDAWIPEAGQAISSLPLR